MPDLLANLTEMQATLHKRGLLGDASYSSAAISGDIVLSPEGRILAFEARRRREMVPTLPKRSGTAAIASLLTGQREYWIGGDTPRHLAARSAMQTLHRRVLGGIDDPSVTAVLALLDHGPRQATPPLPRLPGLMVARVGNVYPHALAAVREAWRAHYAPGGHNPHIRVHGAHGLTRLVSDNMPTARSYGRPLTLSPGIVSSAYGDALNYLLDRPGTVRLGEVAFIAWLDATPEIDPTPYLLSFREGNEPWPEIVGGNLHVAALRAVPPARIAVEMYIVEAADRAIARMRAVHAALVKARAWYREPPLRSVWMAALSGSPRQSQLVGHCLTAFIEGRTPPSGILHEIIQLNRKKLDFLDARVALLSIMLGFERVVPADQAETTERPTADKIRSYRDASFDPRNAVATRRT